MERRFFHAVDSDRVDPLVQQQQVGQLNSLAGLQSLSFPPSPTSRTTLFFFPPFLQAIVEVKSFMPTLYCQPLCFFFFFFFGLFFRSTQQRLFFFIPFLTSPFFLPKSSSSS